MEVWKRRCALLIAFSLLAFGALLAAAMAVYPGGNWFDRAAHGHSFFANYFCDLTQPVSLSGVNNRLGASLAQLAMLAFAAALAGFFWLVPLHFASHPRASVWVRALGGCSVLCYLAVPFTPSEIFGDVHAALSLLAGALGLSAALCAVWALLRSTRVARALGVVGALAVAAGVVHALLFVRSLHAGEPAPLIVPAIQKLAALLSSAWMLGVAWLTLSPEAGIER
jgi:hypothetical protein